MVLLVLAFRPHLQGRHHQRHRSDEAIWYWPCSIGDINRGDIERGSKDLSDEYFGMLEHAVREGKRIGVEISLFNCPGWSQIGGPWVKPEQSMRYINCTERRVKGSAKFEGKLAEPERISPPEKPVPEDLVQDVAVIAFPAPRSDTDTVSLHLPTITCSPAVENAQMLVDGKQETAANIQVLTDKKFEVVINITLPQPFTARSLTIRPPSRAVEHDRMKPAFDADCELLAEGNDGNLHSVQKFKFERANFSESTGPMPRGPVATAFTAQTSRHFQLVMKNFKVQTNQKIVAIAEIELSGAARLDRYIEKQMGKMFSGIQPPWDYYLYLPGAGA